MAWSCINTFWCRNPCEDSFWPLICDASQGHTFSLIQKHEIGILKSCQCRTRDITVNYLRSVQFKIFIFMKGYERNKSVTLFSSAQARRASTSSSKWAPDAAAPLAFWYTSGTYFPDKYATRSPVIHANHNQISRKQMCPKSHISFNCIYMCCSQHLQVLLLDSLPPKCHGTSLSCSSNAKLVQHYPADYK